MTHLIEVSAPSNASTKERGDLLENLVKRLLLAQSYDVETEVRLTAVELDLLCCHTINKKTIYVECKAYRDKNIDANILKNLLGTLILKNYSEAWLITTSDFGKDAKGFIHEWKTKPQQDAEKLSFYGPQEIITSLINANVIQSPPKSSLIEAHNLADQILLITPYGFFWATPILSGGIPTKVIFHHASNNQPVIDTALLDNIRKTDTTLNELEYILDRPYEPLHKDIPLANVVQVQTGDSWSDYRPARPEDFVGRKKDIIAIFELFNRIKENKTPTRIFAITGDSGMGKSSLIVQLANKSKNIQNKGWLFIYAVDLRAAKTSSYINSALLNCLRSAQTSGFGDPNININITDINSTLNSESVKSFIESVAAQGKIITLIFDQFEELYSKSELFDVFEKSKSLLIDTAAMQSNFCLGFAWKTDSTTHSEHPAYFFWHQLSDLRMTRKLSPFTDGDSTTAINIFEKAINQKIHKDLRHNLMVGSQGYPWLLKKLCIHIYNRIENGADQKNLLENKLDVATLFDNDLNELSAGERACLDFIASRAPVDWYEVMQNSSPETLTSLINKRLALRSGDRINIYWDIFREYILTKKVPVIPLSYLPATDFSSLFKVAKLLNTSETISIEIISNLTGFSEGTIQNIATDLNTFEISNREAGQFVLSEHIKDTSEQSILRVIREKFLKHVFVIALKERPSNAALNDSDAINLLKSVFPNNQYSERTWHVYKDRLCRWLTLCGLITQTNQGLVYRDSGDVSLSSQLGRLRASKYIFTAPATPEKVIQDLEYIEKNGPIGIENSSHGELRNSINILKRFQAIIFTPEKILSNTMLLAEYPSNDFLIYSKSAQEESIKIAIDLILADPETSGPMIGNMLKEKYSLDWSEASILRNGYAIKKWATWVLNYYKR